jgi:hypothetical protein
MFLNGSDKNMTCVPEVAYAQITNLLLNKHLYRDRNICSTLYRQ